MKKKILLMIFTFILMFAGFLSVKAATRIGNCDGKNYYYYYGESGGGTLYVNTCAGFNAAYVALYEQEGWSGGVARGAEIQAECEAAVGVNNKVYVRVGGTCRYYVDNVEVFCLDGITDFLEGENINYVASGSTVQNEGMACALIELYDKLKFDDQGKVKMDEISDEDIFEIQHKMWSHQYDGATCTSNGQNQVVKEVNSSIGWNKKDATAELSGSYYVAGPFKVGASNVNPDNNNVTFTLTGAPTGSMISTTTSASGKVTNGVVNKDTEVYVLIPASGVTSNLDVTISVAASLKSATVITIVSTFQQYVDQVHGSQKMGIPNLERSFSERFGNKSTSTNITVPRTHGSIKVVKKVKDTETPLAGATFAITKSDGNPAVDINGHTVASKTTGATGEVTFENLPYGSYIINEVTAPEGYIPFKSSQEVTLNSTLATVRFDNTPMKITIEKKDFGSGDHIAGARLVLLDGTYTAVNTGWDLTSQSVVFNVKAGTYYLYEQSQPGGYQKVNTALKFEINASGLIVNQVEGTINVDQHQFTNGTGTGLYAVDGDKIKVTVYNKKLTYISKKDIASSNELPGADMKVYKYNSGTGKLGDLADSWTSTEAPHSNYYPEGQYVLVEEVAPSAYKKLTTAFLFSVSNTGVPTLISVGTLDSSNKFTATGNDSDNVATDGNTLIVLNELIKVKISKKDITTEAELEGAKIKITSDNKDFKAIEFTSGKTPKELELGRLGKDEYYYLEETAEPVGYEPLNTVFKFTIQDDGTPKLIAIGKWNKNKFVVDKNLTDKYVKFPDKKSKDQTLITMLNEPIKTEIYKMDSKGKKILAGAKIVVTNLSTKKEVIITTTDKVYSYWFGPGKYSLEEKTAPEGYEKSEIVYKFEILNSGKIKLLSTDNTNIKVEDNKIIIYNTIIEPGDTGKNVQIFYIMGAVLLMLGSTIVYFVVRKKQVSNA